MKKNKFIYSLCLIFVCFNLNAKNISENFKSNSYKEAKNQNNYLKFVGISTKLGFISTQFDGYAKEYKIEGKISDDNKFIENIKFSIISKSLDTDIESRNDKLYEKCLKIQKNPEIVAHLDQKVALIESDGTVPAFLKVVEKEIPIPLNYKIEKDGQSWKIKFNSKFSLAEAGIEDPSIMIAKVDDQFQIEGSFSLK